MRRCNMQSRVIDLSMLFVVLCGANQRVNADFAFGPLENLGPHVNSPHSEACPFLSADGLTLYWGSFEVYGGGDLWFSTRSSHAEPWGPKADLGPLVNSTYGEGFPVISDDGLTLYFASNRQGSYGWLDIYETTRSTRADPWGEPVNLGPIINDVNAQDGHSLSPDGLSMYFVSCADWPGSQGSCDIWVTTRSSTADTWEAPVNLGPTVNSSVQDWTTCLSRDGRWLFFGSKRSGGYGESDLWVTRRRLLDAPWEKPINLGSAVNAVYSEATPHISADNSTLLFWSDRPGGIGGWDIWQVPVLPIVDFNSDGAIDCLDVCDLVDHWGTDSSLYDIGPTPLGDGVVDAQDLLVLAEHMVQDAGDVNDMDDP